MVIPGIGYFLTVELTSIAIQITGYTDNIPTKITALRRSLPEWALLRQIRRLYGIPAICERRYAASTG